MQEKRWNLGCVGGGKDIKKIFSLNRVFLNNPTIILCFSAHHWASDYHALQSGPHQRRQPDRENGNEWLAGHLTVGYQRDNNVWRQAGAVYVLQKNNCYPFKSHFLIGLAVVEGNLERRQVRERLRVRQRERVRRGQGERRAEERKSLLLTTHCVPACVYVYMSGGLV